MKLYGTEDNTHYCIIVINSLLVLVFVVNKTSFNCCDGADLMEAPSHYQENTNYFSTNAH